MGVSFKSGDGNINNNGSARAGGGGVVGCSNAIRRREVAPIVYQRD